MRLLQRDKTCRDGYITAGGDKYFIRIDKLEFFYCAVITPHNRSIGLKYCENKAPVLAFYRGVDIRRVYQILQPEMLL
jgi:hypothetical protein